MVRIWFKMMLVLLISSSVLAFEYNYNFDSLSTGSLAGQDGWTITAGMTATVYDVGGGNLAVNLINGTNYVLRAGSFVLTEKLSSYQADFLYFGGALNQTERFYLAGSGTTSPWLGINGGQIETRGMTGKNAYSPAVRANAPTTFNIGDWITLRMTFNADNTATVAYKNLTDGETGFTNVADFTNYDIGLGSVGDIDTYLKSFTDLRMRSDGSTPSGQTRAVDNLNVTEYFADCETVLYFDVTGPQGQSDCIVDIYDLAEFAGEWLVSTRPSDSCVIEVDDGTLWDR